MEPKDWLLCLQDPPLVHILGEVKAVTPACPVSLEAICIIAHHTHTVLDCPNVFFPLGISDVHFVRISHIFPCVQHATWDLINLIIFLEEYNL